MSIELPTQLPPADELYATREQIKALAAREEELRHLMINDPSARTGNRYAAVIREGSRMELDRKELRAAYPEAVDEHTYPIKTVTVEMWGISEDGELVSLRRKATA